MAASTSPAALAAKFAQLQAGLAGATRAGVTAGALLVTTSVRAQLRRAAPSGRLKGVGRSGARISVGFDAPRSDVRPGALIRMRGPAHLIERDTKPHEITPRRRGVKALSTSHGPKATVKRHPGTTGKHPFEKGVAAVAPKVPDVVRAETFKAVRKAFT